MAFWQRLARDFHFLLASPVCVGVPAAAMAAQHLWLRARGRRPLAPERRPDTSAASIVIPNWNGRDLLERYLPSVLAATAGNPAHEVIVVDDASTDGSADFVAEHFPTVRVVRNAKNLGFGGGSNAGFRAAKNDVVVLLNSDMRVEPDFLQPLLDGFIDEKVFAVSCQIFFSDPQKLREETGLTQGWWQHGGLRVRHRIDEKVDRLFPCFYGGGGSCAFDRRKFFELGGFDELLKPFYLEDTDLGMMAWKRGWKVLYQPASRVFHEHRGTIGKKFPQEYIQSIVKKNFVLFCWKNIHEGPRLAEHFLCALAGAWLTVVFGESNERPSPRALWRAFLQLPEALRSRARAFDLAAVSDTEAFRRSLPGYYYDRFARIESAPARPRVLFLSPYPILPPVHGGAVFMSQTLFELVKHVPVHLVTLLEAESQRGAHAPFDSLCASTEYMVRMEGRPKGVGSLAPFAVREFANDDLRWAIHRTILLHGIDVLQIEYTNMGQYAEEFRQVVNVLFEHDVYFQSVHRMLAKPGSALGKLAPAYEYLRALRYELTMLPGMDRIQMCSRSNERYLVSFAPELQPKLQSGLRAGIDTGRYEFRTEGREPDTLLFLGSFRHIPNREALEWFVQHVWPLVIAARPSVRLVILGSDPPPRHSLPESGQIELIGYVDDVREALARYAVFVCPILTGSGVRVKLLEAFAAGIPVVSTGIGAEGLTERDGEICALADDPAGFADRVLGLLGNPGRASALAERARAEVTAHWDMTTITHRLADSYREAVAEKRAHWSS